MTTDEIRDAMRQWSEKLAREFDEVHQWPPALRAIRLMQEQPLATWYMNDLARAAGTSSATLERSFREIYGVTPQRYHVLLRIRSTVPRIRSEEGSLEGVVRTAGWPTLNEFARSLRRATGWRVSALRICPHDEYEGFLRAAVALPLPRLARQPTGG